jgi:hypothetical protein
MEVKELVGCEPLHGDGWIADCRLPGSLGSARPAGGREQRRERSADVLRELTDGATGE